MHCSPDCEVGTGPVVTAVFEHICQRVYSWRNERVHAFEVLSASLAIWTSGKSKLPCVVKATSLD